MIRLRIEPAPDPDEAAAIEAAIRALVARWAAHGDRLSYADVARGQMLHDPWLGWSDVARLEALDSGV